MQPLRKGRRAGENLQICVRASALPIDRKRVLCHLRRYDVTILLPFSDNGTLYLDLYNDSHTSYFLRYINSCGAQFLIICA